MSAANAIFTYASFSPRLDRARPPLRSADISTAFPVKYPVHPFDLRHGVDTSGLIGGRRLKSGSLHLVAINPEGTSLRGNKSEIGKRSPVATNPEGHAFTRANKRHAEGVTALPKARLYALPLSVLFNPA
jgi:hypothetical protein